MKTTRDNFATMAAGVAEATTNAGQIKNTNAFSYVIGGRGKLKAATTDVAMAAHPGTAFVNLGNHQVTALFVMIDAAGALTIIQSPVKTASTGVGYVPGAFEWPGDLEGYACIGAILVRTGAVAFTVGTTDLSAASITATYHDAVLDYGKPVLY